MASSEERINLSTEPPVTPLHADNDSELSSRGVPQEALTHQYDERVPLGERPNPDNIGNQMNRNPLMDIGGIRGFIKQNRTRIMAAAGTAGLVLGLWAARSRREEPPRGALWRRGGRSSRAWFG
jgi:hypothetical protein